MTTKPVLFRTLLEETLQTEEKQIPTRGYREKLNKIKTAVSKKRTKKTAKPIRQTK